MVERGCRIGRTRVRENKEALSLEKDILKLVCCFYMCQLLLLEILIIGIHE